MITLGGGPSYPTLYEIGYYNSTVRHYEDYTWELTPKQLKRLQLYAEGLTLEAIAQIEGRHRSSVGESLHRAAATLRVKGLKQAARKARVYGLVECRPI